jgi:hypothetical protein
MDMRMITDLLQGHDSVSTISQWIGCGYATLVSGCSASNLVGNTWGCSYNVSFNVKFRNELIKGESSYTLRGYPGADRAMILNSSVRSIKFHKTYIRKILE